jgi:hypothetical protein
MALAAFDALVGIIATNAARLLDGFDTLGIHDGRARVWIPPDPPPLGFP